MLTDILLKNTKATGKVFKIADHAGLYVHISKKGTKCFRFDYSYQGKRKTYTIGKYPYVSLAQARQKHFDLKNMLENNIDPADEKKAQKQAAIALVENSFEFVARQWIETKQRNHTAKHKQDITSKLERFIFPTFSKRDISTITAKEILTAIRKIEAKGRLETSKKTLGICNQVFSYAIGEGKAEYNVCTSLANQLQPHKVKHYSFISDKKIFGKLLKDIDTYPRGILIKSALQLAPLLFVRPSELIEAKWSEFSFDEKLWTIPSERMKLSKKHTVPLSKQALAIFKLLYEFTGAYEHVFANIKRRGHPICVESVRHALTRLGYTSDVITLHGFRHTASTMLNELGYNSDHIEKQLAHTNGNSVRATYNHAQYLAERRKMMQEWSDFCDRLKKDQ